MFINYKVKIGKMFIESRESPMTCFFHLVQVIVLYMLRVIIMYNVTET